MFSRSVALSVSLTLQPSLQNLWVTGAYEKYIFPRMYDGLKLLVVPPTWGANETCREKPSVWCTNQTYAEWVQLNLGNLSFYTQWVASEPRIVGFGG